MSSILPEIPVNKRGSKNGGWEVHINGENQTDSVCHIKMVHERYGAVEFGLRENGAYAGPIIAEYRGGGVVLILYAYINNKLWVGIVRQNRHNMYSKYSVPAGFIHKKESRSSSVERVFDEEISNYFSERVIFLNEKRGVNANRAFFWTPKREEGLSFHALELRTEELVTDDGIVYRLKTGLFDPKSDKKIEYIQDCVLVPFEVAVHYVQDDFIHIGVSLLQAYLNHSAETAVMIAGYHDFFKRS